MIKVTQVGSGIDFLFKNIHDGNKFVDVIKGNYPIILKTSKQFISYNERDNTSNINYQHYSKYVRVIQLKYQENYQNNLEAVANYYYVQNCHLIFIFQIYQIIIKYQYQHLNIIYISL